MIRDTSLQDEVWEKPHGLTRNRVVILIAVVVALGAGTFAYPSLQRWSSAEQTMSRERLRLATVIRGDLTRDISSQGKVIAAIKPTLFSPASGVVDLKVRPGDSVDRGQLLAQVESPALLSQLEQETSALSSAETRFKRQQIQARQVALQNQQQVDMAQVALVAAKRELRRAEAAHAKEAISEFDYDKANDDVARAELSHRHAAADAQLQQESLAFELQNAELDIAHQRLRVTELERQVAELAITSPVTGIVGNLLVEDRDAVAHNQPIVTVVDLTAFEVELQVPDSYASALEIALDAEVSHQG